LRDINVTKADTGREFTGLPRADGGCDDDAIPVTAFRTSLA